jgi:hypothetical protein
MPVMHHPVCIANGLHKASVKSFPEFGRAPYRSTDTFEIKVVVKKPLLIHPYAMLHPPHWYGTKHAATKYNADFSRGEK